MADGPWTQYQTPAQQAAPAAQAAPGPWTEYQAPAAPVKAGPVVPEETYVAPTATPTDLAAAAKAWGLNPDLIAKSKFYNFNDAAKDNATPLGYDADLIDTFLNKVGVGQDVNQGATNMGQQMMNAVASTWRSPEDQEGAKFALALKNSNYAQRQMKGQAVEQTTGQYSKPLGQMAGELGMGMATAAPAAALVAGAVPEIAAAAGLGKLGQTIASGAAQGATYGGVGSPEHPLEGAAIGALAGGALSGAAAGLKALAPGVDRTAPGYVQGIQNAVPLEEKYGVQLTQAQLDAAGARSAGKNALADTIIMKEHAAANANGGAIADHYASQAQAWASNLSSDINAAVTRDAPQPDLKAMKDFQRVALVMDPAGNVRSLSPKSMENAINTATGTSPETRALLQGYADDASILNLPKPEKNAVTVARQVKDFITAHRPEGIAAYIGHALGGPIGGMVATGVTMGVKAIANKGVAGSFLDTAALKGLAPVLGSAAPAASAFAAASGLVNGPVPAGRPVNPYAAANTEANGAIQNAKAPYQGGMSIGGKPILGPADWHTNIAMQAARQTEEYNRLLAQKGRDVIDRNIGLNYTRPTTPSGWDSLPSGLNESLNQVRGENAAARQKVIDSLTPAQKAFLNRKGPQ